MEYFISFIQEWGYLAVFLGSLVEGESIILTASAMAYAGYLSLYKVMIIAFSGTLMADQVLYYIGRKYGTSIFERFPSLKKPSDRAFTLLRKYDTWFIIMSRFVYGVRTAGSMVVGASGVPPRRFVPLNILSAAIWTVISCVGGYLLGDIMIKVIENFDMLQKYIFAGIFCFIALGAIYLFYKKRQAKSL